MVEIPWQTLFAAAQGARQRAHAPYSNFQVGAAVLSAEGTVSLGCNVENASYGLTVCAERNAIASMLVSVAKVPLAVAIVTDAHAPTPPCGACRQVLAEFGSPELQVGSRTVHGQEMRWTLADLLPQAFTRSLL